MIEKEIDYMLQVLDTSIKNALYICTLCILMYFMHPNALYASLCTLCILMHFMHPNALYAS